MHSGERTSNPSLNTLEKLMRSFASVSRCYDVMFGPVFVPVFVPKFVPVHVSVFVTVPVSVLPLSLLLLISFLS